MSMHYYPQTDLNQQNLDWIINTLKDLQTQVDNGGIKVVTLAANMTDHNVIYVYEGSEVGMNTDHWYYWDTLNQVWVDGGGWGGGAITLPLVIADGGTGATSAAQARTNLGLGSLALENNPLNPSKGGTGQTSLQSTRNAMGLGNTTGALPVANGGTGKTSIAAARNAFGLGNTTGPVPIANGGTGSATAAAALTALGAEPAITALPISKGGTGAQTAAAARTALGVVGTADVIDIAHGGTGATSAENARVALGFDPIATYTPTFQWSDSSTLTVANINAAYVMCGHLMALYMRFQITDKGESGNKVLNISYPTGVSAMAGAGNATAGLIIPETANTANIGNLVVRPAVAQLTVVAGAGGGYSYSQITTGYYTLFALIPV